MADQKNQNQGSQTGRTPQGQQSQRTAASEKDSLRDKERKKEREDELTEENRKGSVNTRDEETATPEARTSQNPRAEEEDEEPTDRNKGRQDRL